ncbi:M20 family metallopeptidase [Algoriphagus antarcticus]|uniref:Succinyl-diaminopimelate desuccinylase n=1 Tax=Algoriphagus antarcticus TaxID=238540 RepID=A0A3E0DH42_9BACT|nr:M20/M25/M40 family metallo-hydrolase [Algoriphagus antarcticus]REG81121.1 succinyl-diaminopimelate desuccinylase [Algoriphagus antarcticus]
MREEIIKLTSELVKIPSRAGIDSVEKIQNYLEKWFEKREIAVIPLLDREDLKVGFYLHIHSDIPGPAICLNSCLDTAPFGDEGQWIYSPTSGIEKDEYLYGRGSADSKVAVSIFSHLADYFQKNKSLLAGDLFFVFDADEHTGNFQGIRSFLDQSPIKPDAVLIGYPGNDKLIIGSRGFLRAEITVYGASAHSGSSSKTGINAISEMAKIIQSIKEKSLPKENNTSFGMGPKVTITEVNGGDGYNLVPDRCSCKLDFRLTPNVNKEVAERWIESIIYNNRLVDGIKPPQIKYRESWPAFHLPVESEFVQLFLEIAQRVFQKNIVPSVSGPSNIGNFLASRGIPALSGFGVSYDQIHATDERVHLETVMPVYEVYRQVILSMMKSKKQFVVQKE